MSKAKKPYPESLFVEFPTYHAKPSGYHGLSWKDMNINIKKKDLDELNKGNLIGIRLNRDSVFWIRCLEAEYD